MSPIIFIIFGATGDLTSRKLMPAIVSLYKQQKISQDILVIGVGRRELTQEEFSSFWPDLQTNLKYIQGSFEDPHLYSKLVETLEEYDKKVGACIPRFFYLATPPEHYETILTHLKDSTLAEGCGQGTINYTRVLIEKPFGKDLETARRLDQLLATVFEEKQIYRIDHYLAKETIQNILAFRFANGIFEPTWNNQFIDHVQITLAETVGIETRGNFYEGIGALRDVIQNHLMQMVSLIAMEQPRAFDEPSVREERTKVVRAIQPFDEQSVQSYLIRGQYTGYRSEKGVDAHSQTETFVALRLFVDTPRWQGVPFYIRTGKKLKQKVTEISLHYKKPALCYDDVCLFDPDKVYRNVLTIQIDPDEQIALRLNVKNPGFGMQLHPVHMDFSYKQEFSEAVHLEAYEKLLLDTIAGDQMLFARTDEIEASWKVVTPILTYWKSHPETLVPYTPGSDGPEKTQTLIENDGRKWYFHAK